VLDVASTWRASGSVGEEAAMLDGDAGEVAGVQYKHRRCHVWERWSGVGASCEPHELRSDAHASNTGPRLDQGVEVHQERLLQLDLVIG
jgi:hypothetical protein